MPIKGEIRQGEWKPLPAKAEDGRPVFSRGPYNPIRVKQATINPPYNCHMGWPLTKYYIVAYGRFKLFVVHGLKPIGVLIVSASQSMSLSP